MQPFGERLKTYSCNMLCAFTFLRPIYVSWLRLLTPFFASCVVDKNVVTWV